jgi:hypothetical protein
VQRQTWDRLQELEERLALERQQSDRLGGHHLAQGDAGLEQRHRAEDLSGDRLKHERCGLARHGDAQRRSSVDQHVHRFDALTVAVDAGPGRQIHDGRVTSHPLDLPLLEALAKGMAAQNIDRRLHCGLHV